MRVLRENKESIIAVLEAFVHDPLINWRLVQGGRQVEGKTAGGDNGPGGARRPRGDETNIYDGEPLRARRSLAPLTDASLASQRMLSTKSIPEQCKLSSACSRNSPVCLAAITHYLARTSLTRFFTRRSRLQAHRRPHCQRAGRQAHRSSYFAREPLAVLHRMGKLLSFGVCRGRP